MTTLTSLVLDPGHPAVARDLANSHDMHRTLTRAALGADTVQTSDDGGPRSHLGLLHRVTSTTSDTEVTVLSQRRLDTTTLPDGYLRSEQTLDYGAYLDTIADGATVRYTLVAWCDHSSLMGNTSSASPVRRHAPTRTRTHVHIESASAVLTVTSRSRSRVPQTRLRSPGRH